MLHVLMVSGQRSENRGRIMKHLFFVLAALVLGAAGGSIGTYAVLVHERGRPEEVIRAHRFELVNDGGKAVSFWGTDSTGYVELAFGHPQGSSSAPHDVGTKDAAALGIIPSIAIGLEGESGRPFLGYNGSDRQLRVLLNLD